MCHAWIDYGVLSNTHFLSSQGQLERWEKGRDWSPPAQSSLHPDFSEGNQVGGVSWPAHGPAGSKVKAILHSLMRSRCPVLLRTYLHLRTDPGDPRRKFSIQTHKEAAPRKARPTGSWAGGGAGEIGWAWLLALNGSFHCSCIGTALTNNARAGLPKMSSLFFKHLLWKSLDLKSIGIITSTKLHLLMKEKIVDSLNPTVVNF